MTRMIMVLAALAIAGGTVAQSQGQRWSAVAVADNGMAYGIASNRESKGKAEADAKQICARNSKQKSCALSKSTSGGIAIATCWENGKMTEVSAIDEAPRRTDAARKVIDRLERDARCPGSYRLNF